MSGRPNGIALPSRPVELGSPPEELFAEFDLVAAMIEAEQKVEHSFPVDKSDRNLRQSARPFRQLIGRSWPADPLSPATESGLWGSCRIKSKNPAVLRNELGNVVPALARAAGCQARVTSNADAAQRQSVTGPR